MGAAAVKQVLDICETLPGDDGKCGTVVPVLVQAIESPRATPEQSVPPRVSRFGLDC